MRATPYVKIMFIIRRLKYTFRFQDVTIHKMTIFGQFSAKFHVPHNSAS